MTHIVNENELFSLERAIAGLRHQIRTAAKRALELPAEERFRITEAEVELTVVAEDSVDGGADVGWWIFKAKANVSAKDVITHKVRLKLDLGKVEVSSDFKTR